ncbi:MAG: FtsX-like permease family protein [Pedosphaera sp.]|nr:FtsX-like permease family protein [Pedosphaera sp.]
MSARLRRSIRLGVRSLWLHRLRSLLTVLGIVFGVCSVIAMLAIGEGASFKAQEIIKTLGSQNILLRSQKPGEEEKISNRRDNYVLEYGLTNEDLKRIRNTIPGVETALPARVIREYVWNIAVRVDVDIVGTLPDYPVVRNHQVAIGRFFNQADLDAAETVCVLGTEMVQKLFPLDEPLGKDVRIGENYYRVIGIMEPRTTGAFSEGNLEEAGGAPRDRMFIPLETARHRYGEVLFRRRAGSFESERVALHEITVKVVKSEDVIPVSEAIKDVLEKNHKKKDYAVVVPLELLKKAEETKKIFNLVLGSIAAISLLVGGIGIMNIMLANVTERTREIGIRRALGARRKDITTQFVIESVILSASGGLLGVLLGVLIPFGVSHFAGMRTIITPGSPILAFTISGLIGVVFGLYPALRAAKMDPVEALRHE